MDRFKIAIIHDDNRSEDFEVTEYLHHTGSHCKFEIFQNDALVVSLEPDRNEFLRVCKNPGSVNYETLNKIIEKLESYNL